MSHHEEYMSGIYLDNAATTRPYTCYKEQDTVSKDESDIYDDVLQNMLWQNPSSRYTASVHVRQILEDTRRIVATFINAEPEEIYFCSSGTEANNLVIQGMYKGIREEVAKKWNNEGRSFKAPQMIFTTTPREHPSVRNIVKSDFFDSYSGSALYTNIDMESKDKLLEHINSEVDKNLFYQPDPAGLLVSIMMANNETGVINNIKEICEIVHRQGGYMHTDATAYIPHLPVDVKDLGVDALTFSGHKLHCPRGVAVMYIKKGTSYIPVIYGGKQESGIRPGTENTRAIYKLGRAIVKHSYENIALGEKELSQAFMDALDYGTNGLCEYVINERPENNLKSIKSVTFKGISSMMLITMLNEYFVCCSSGSACSSGSEEPSKVLLNYGLSEEDARCTIRFSLDARENTLEAMKRFGEILRRCLEDIKRLDVDG